MNKGKGRLLVSTVMSPSNSFNLFYFILQTVSHQHEGFGLVTYISFVYHFSI